MMIRSYQQGENQLPQANGLQRSLYTVKAHLKAGELKSGPYAVYEIDEWDDTNKRFTVKRPTSASLPQAQLLIGPGHAVEADNTFMASQATDAITVAADTGQTVAVGDNMGTQADSYRLKVGNTGFKALRYESSEGRALVRPFSSGGGLDFLLLGNPPTRTAVGPASADTYYYTSWIDIPLSSQFDLEEDDTFELYIRGVGSFGSQQIEITIDQNGLPSTVPVAFYYGYELGDSSGNVIAETSADFLLGAYSYEDPDYGVNVANNSSYTGPQVIEMESTTSGTETVEKFRLRFKSSSSSFQSAGFILFIRPVSSLTCGLYRQRPLGKAIYDSF